MEYDVLEEKMRSLVESGDSLAMCTFVGSPADYNDSENMVGFLLRAENCPSEWLEKALEGFVSTKPNRASSCYYGGGHMGWVHSLSHFMGNLWERRMDDWIKKLNDMAFRGAIEFNDSGCCDRLVSNFVEFAKWNEDPANFSITEENLVWMVPDEYNGYTIAYIAAAPFASELDFQLFLMRNSKNMTWDGEAQTDLVNSEGIRTKLEKIRELGGDVNEFDSLERDLLTETLAKLEKDIRETEHEHVREWREIGVRKTREALEQLEQAVV